MRNPREHITPGSDAEHSSRAAFLESLLDSVGGVVWEFDWSTGAFTYVSEGAERLLGFTTDQWKTPGFWMDRLHPDDREWAPTFCVEATKDLRDHEFEYRMIHADGRTVWVRDIVSVDPVKGMDGALRGLLIDISAEKSREEELARSVSEFDALFESTRNLYFRIDADLIVRGYKAASTDALFVPPESFIDRHINDVLPEQFAPAIRNALDALRETGQPQIFEYELPAGDVVRAYEAQFVPLRDSEAAIIVRDITAGRDREAALRESEERFRAVTHNVPLGIDIFTAEPDGTFILTAANPAADEILGIRHADLIGARVLDAYPGLASQVEFVEQVRIALATHKPMQIDELRYESDTRRGIFEASLFPISANQMAALFRDVTERSAAAEREHEYLQRLSALTTELTLAEDRERRRLAEDLHDRVSQPLAVSRMHLRGAELDTESYDQSELAIGVRLLDEAIRETRVITTELFPPVLAELGLAASLHWLCDEMERAYGLRAQTISTREPDLSDDAKLLMFRAARELLLNVVKHSGRDEAVVRLDILRNGVELSVEDFGIGMDVEAAQAEMGKHGFGLFSIRERLPGLGGSIEIDSVSDRGTRVAIFMPTA